jgi:hypothetical protein
MLILGASMSGPIPGKAFLDRVIRRVWEANQHAYDREAFELGAIVLRLLGDVKRKIGHGRGFSEIASSGTLSPLDSASIQAHGMRFAEWGRRNELRKSAAAWELSRIVDYDPEMEPKNGIRRPEAGTGNLYKMPSAKKPSQQKPLRILPEETAANQ